jgi:hypothetical protein
MGWKIPVRYRVGRRCLDRGYEPFKALRMVCLWYKKNLVEKTSVGCKVSLSPGVSQYKLISESIYTYLQITVEDFCFLDFLERHQCDNLNILGLKKVVMTL